MMQTVSVKHKHLAHLHTKIEAFNGCNLKHTANTMVFGGGDTNAKIMLIGEAPGAEEDATGKPFVGRSGKLLTKMLGESGFTRESVYITNMCPWRPPNNRTPTTAELKMLRPFVEEHISIIAPKIVVLVGNTPAKTLLDTKIGITQTHGQFFPYHNRFMGKNGTPILAMPLYHPAYILRNPKQRATVVTDLQTLNTKLKAL